MSLGPSKSKSKRLSHLLLVGWYGHNVFLFMWISCPVKHFVMLVCEKRFVNTFDLFIVSIFISFFWQSSTKLHFVLFYRCLMTYSELVSMLEELPSVTH